MVAVVDTDPERLATPHYFGSNEPRNVGIDCGRSRLLVIDEDAHDELAQFCADHSIDMPATFTVRTGKGCHYYFRLPDGVDLGNREGAFTGYHINIRGVGGYVVAPGSRHATGVQYTVEDSGVDVLLAPQWLLAAVTAKPDQGDTDGDGEAVVAARPDPPGQTTRRAHVRSRARPPPRAPQGGGRPDPA